MRKLMRERRDKLGLSQQEVADRAGLSRANYSHIERGRREQNLKQMIGIAKVLKTNPDAYFFKDYCDEKEQKTGGQKNVS